MSLSPQTTLHNTKAAEAGHAPSQPEGPLFDDSRFERRSTKQPFLPVYVGAKFANPSPLAFVSLAVSLYLISMVAMGTDNLSSLSIIPSVALGFSAFGLLISGIFEFPCGNPFAASLYITLAGLLTGLTLILSSWSGIASSYTNAGEFAAAVAQFFYAFFISIVIFTVAAHRSSGGLVCFLCLVDLTLLFLGLHFSYPAHTSLLTAGGAFSVTASFVAWYAALASLLTHETSLFTLPVLGDFTPKEQQ